MHLDNLDAFRGLDGCSGTRGGLGHAGVQGDDLGIWGGAMSCGLVAEALGGGLVVDGDAWGCSVLDCVWAVVVGGEGLRFEAPVILVLVLAVAFLVLVDLAVIAIALLNLILQSALRYAGMVGQKLVVVWVGVAGVQGQDVGAGAHKQVGGAGVAAGAGAGAGAATGAGVTSTGDSRASAPTAGDLPMVRCILVGISLLAAVNGSLVLV